MDIFVDWCYLSHVCCSYTNISFTIYSRVSIFERVADHYVLIVINSISHMDAAIPWLNLNPNCEDISHKNRHLCDLKLFATWDVYVSCSYTIYSRVSIFAWIVDYYVIVLMISISHLDAVILWLNLDPNGELISHKTIHFSTLTLFAISVVHMSISPILFIVESQFLLGY